MAEYIERQSVYDVLRKAPISNMGTKLYIYDDIADIPAADVVERKRGYNAKADYPSLFECSLCGWSDYDTMTGDSIEYNYCPNCGADMRGE